jgi:hypothetical protein
MKADFTYPMKSEWTGCVNGGGSTIAYIQLLLALLLSLFEPGHHNFPGRSAAGVTLGIPKQFAVTDIHLGSVLEVIHGEIEKVFLRLEAFETFIVGLEELEPFFVVVHAAGIWPKQVHCFLQLLQTVQLRASACYPDLDSISLRQLPSQLGGQNPFQMDVELNLGYFEDKFVVGC